MTARAVVSIDALLADDPCAIDDDALKQHLQQLGDARARLDAAELEAVAEFNHRQGYTADGMTDARAWLAHHTGVARATAGATVWLARRIRMMPAFDEALAAGSIRYGHVRVMAHALSERTLGAFVRDEAMLVEQASKLEADDFAVVVTRWKYLNDPNGPDQGGEKPSELHVSPMLDGRHRIDGELDLEDSVEYTAELERLYEEIWREDHSDAASDDERKRTRSQRYAAAQVEMARRSSVVDDEGKGAKEPLIIVRADLPALEGDPSGTAELDDGTQMALEIVQRWLCDCAIGRVVMAGESIPFDLGKITYIASSGQRRVLKVRDRGCIVPGCKRKPKWCQVHHVIPWPKGPTDINNLVLLCHRHHKHVHRGIIKILPGDRAGTFIVTKADGSRMLERPPPARVAA